MAIAQVATAALPIIGGLLGDIFSSEDRERAEQLLLEAVKEIEAVGAPPDLSRELILEKFYQAGFYTPELEQAIDLGISQVSQVQEDPELRAAQTRALELLQQKGEIGLGPEERVELNKISQKLSRSAKASEADITRELQQRGLSGSGLEFALRQQVRQQAENAAAMEAQEQAALASRRALEALTQSGQLAGQIRGQDFDVASTKAAAADEFQRFNVQSAQAREQRRVAAENEARKRQADTEQRLAEANIQQSNLEKQRQRQAEQTEYELARQRAADLAKAKGAAAGVYSDRAGQTAATLGKLGQGAGEIVAASTQRSLLPSSSAEDEEERRKRELQQAALSRMSNVSTIG